MLTFQTLLHDESILANFATAKQTEVKSAAAVIIGPDSGIRRSKHSNIDKIATGGTGGVT